MDECRTIVHETGDGIEPQPGNFGLDLGMPKPHRQSSANCSSRFPGATLTSTKSLSRPSLFTSPAQTRGATFIIKLSSKQRPRPSLRSPTCPIGAQSPSDPTNCSSKGLGRVGSLRVGSRTLILSIIKRRGQETFIHASLVQRSAETMTQYSLPPIFEELQHPANSATQLSALKVLKNELIGHELRKRTWINHGIIPILSRILSSRRSHSGKRATRESHVNGFQDVRGVLSDDDASCLQAAVILGILAHGRTISLL